MWGGVLLSAAGRAAGVFGAEQVVGAMTRFAVKAAMQAFTVDRESADEMVALMQERVPQDTGQLHGGITATAVSGGFVVSAAAENAYGVDYGWFVEAGTKAGRRGGRVHHVANDSYFASFDRTGRLNPASGRRYRSPGGRKVYRDHPGTEAQPFFWPSVREVQAKRALRLERITDDVPPELQ